MDNYPLKPKLINGGKIMIASEEGTTIPYMDRRRHHIPGSDNSGLLWERLFKARVPYLQSRTIEDLKNTGVVLSGIPEIDQDIPNQWVTSYMSIATMTGYYKEHVPVRVALYEDCKTIYELIVMHITNWRHFVDNAINIGNAPFEELIDLDDFASIVYDKAKYTISKDIRENYAKQFMTGGHRFHEHNLFKQNFYHSKKSQEEKEAIKPENMEHNSMGEFLKQKLSHIRRY